MMYSQYISEIKCYGTLLPRSKSFQLHTVCRFILESTTDVCKGVDSRRVRSQEKIKEIEGQISYWKKGVKETEENIRDMVSQRREK